MSKIQIIHSRNFDLLNITLNHSIYLAIFATFSLQCRLTIERDAIFHISKSEDRAFKKQARKSIFAGNYGSEP